MKRKLAWLLPIALLACLASTSPRGEQALALQEPLVSEEESLPGGRKTTWDCVTFGSYPISEVLPAPEEREEDILIREGDEIIDEALYQELTQAEWDEEELLLDGERYRRVGTRYFAYQPIKWRVVEIQDTTVLLMADRLLDSAPFHVNAQSVSWADCTLRSFLNGYGPDQNKAGLSFEDPRSSFLGTAFSEEEQQALVEASLENKPNYYFKTDSGSATTDRVFLFAEEDIFETGQGLAGRHGFAPSDGTRDCARRFVPTPYALAKGAWHSPVKENAGNGFWFLRTSGYTKANANYICDFGSVFNRGTYVTLPDAGVLPVILVDLSKANLATAGTVSSDEIFRPGASPASTNPTAEEVQAANDPKEAHGYHEPVIELDDTLSSGLRTTWDTLCFGSYPASEVVPAPTQPVEDYALEEGDILVDAQLYEQLCEAAWEEGETVIGEERYRRLKAEDVPDHREEMEQYYRWEDEDYHYFRYEPITWRILELEGDEALLLCDREMDCVPYHESSCEVTWETSTLRSFLNGYGPSENADGADFSEGRTKSFYESAFSEEEKACILTSELANPENSYYGTGGGENTQDQIFVLSSEEVFASPAAARHGFYPGGGIDDPARRFGSTLYAKARGTWYSPMDGYLGNGFWFMRTSGYNLQNATYICDFGYIYNRGTDVTCNDAGILPAVRVDLTALIALQE